jgi:oligo-1,6-glucosidase
LPGRLTTIPSSSTASNTPSEASRSLVLCYLYKGDELGMTNYPWTKISEFNDIEVQNRFKTEVAQGKLTEQQLIAGAAAYGRDNARTPMQWDTTRNAGFTTGNHTWEPVNPNYLQINAADQVKDPDSVYHYNQKVIALRRSDPAFIYGDYQDLDPHKNKSSSTPEASVHQAIW